HRNYPVSVPPQVIADEVTGPQLVLRQADDGDRPGVVNDTLNRQRILVPRQIERLRRSGRAHTATPAAPTAPARANPCSRSQIKSSIVSMPTESRMVPGPTPAARSSSSFSWRCAVLPG